ncbi:MAG: hypothetical protein SF052_03145 [Bacteroidia bacterium]|nr:hypothetical protein [Bacteroidia bacterium]
MKRKELFEFEDFPWLPNVIRTGVTNLIVVFHKLAGTAEVIADLILNVREKYNFTQITDLGSGSGGPMLEVIQKINAGDKHSKMNLVLTDFYPNPAIVDKINKQKLPNIRYQDTSLDATQINTAPDGLKTMIASFHHMKPATAQKILQSAQHSRQPILIYELAKNNIPILLWWLFLPLSLVILIVMCLIMTPFVKPLSFKQILFTYLIPIIPLVYAWDGQTSLMRTYTFEDIESLLGSEKKEDYQWAIGDAQKRNGKKFGYYIMGYPKSENGL